MTPTIEDVLLDRELRLRWLPGRGKRMVVVFTGMHAGVMGQPLDEFAGSAWGGGENNVLFVTDRRATWYAAPGLWRRIVKLVKYLRDSEGLREVISLGNSMGGYGAMLLPRDVRVTRVVAFSPQVTMDRKLLADDRWPDVGARFTLPVRNVGDVIGRARAHFYVMAGADCAPDLEHLALLPDHKRLHRYILAKGRHNVAHRLKSAGVLGDVIAAIIKGRKARVESLLGDYRAVA